MKKRITAAVVVMMAGVMLSMAQTRWSLESDGGIAWQGKELTTHNDHIEMSGKSVSVVYRYGIDKQGTFYVNKGMVWPMLRTVPNNTHASLMYRVGWDMTDDLRVDNHSLSGERVEKVTLHGKLYVKSKFDNGVVVERTYFPSADKPASVEILTLRNESKKEMIVEMPYLDKVTYTDPKKGVKGSYGIRTKVCNPRKLKLAPGQSAEFCGLISAAVEGEKALQTECHKELEARMALVGSMEDNLQLETPDPIINRMFAFSKLRACESIFETAGGPMHAPGGESYYAAIWANDQAEYVNPFFPFVGYDYGNKSALTSYLMFARFMNDEGKPIPSSIIAEGSDIWNGAGDRGDAAMIAHGAARYVLAQANMDDATALWPLIKWCLDYCDSRLNSEGVVLSDCDELEFRFPAGEANLCTSSLYYDALLSASYLAPIMGEAQLASKYKSQAAKLRTSINKYFAGPVEGFDTYAYYKGNDVLRSWICIPLAMGIDEKAQATLDAMFSPRLWTQNGMLTQAGTETYWDRSTLYGLRGAFYVGATEKALDYLHRYSETRLLGDHVPYAIEAWPEGSQRHLSAESGLYGRIITEGLFGIRPTGFSSFSLTPHLPKAWNEMTLRHIRAFGSDFDIKVAKNGKKLKVTVSQNGSTQSFTMANGQTKEIKLR